MRILHIHLLGTLELVYDGVPMTNLSARLQSLLAYLLLHRDAPQTCRFLAFLFWPDSTESKARTNLRKLLHDLRSSLPDANRFLDMAGQLVQWRADAPFTLDVADFEAAVRPAESAPELEAAVALYRGDLLPSCYDDWILPERERLHQMIVDALEQLIALLEGQRDYRKAIAYAQQLLQHDPLREDTYRRLMQLYAVCGDRTGVLRTYHACATSLQRELEVEPSLATRQACEHVLNLDGALALLPPATPRLVGRNAEWAQLQAAWRAAAAGQPRWALLTGEEGIGKTRLAEELLQWAARQGIATASTRCYASTSASAYAPVTALLRAHPLPWLDKIWLGELARLLPELLTHNAGLRPPGPLTEGWQRNRFFEALARAVLARRPFLLLIDDLQWCDTDTLEWLPYLLRFDPHARLLLVSTARLDRLGADRPLAELLPTLRRIGQLTEIDLGPLTEAETTLLAVSVTGRQLDPALASRLFQETRGNPLFILEIARAGLPAGRLRQAELASLPQSVHTAIEARLAQLSPAARELTRLAATVGRAFTPDVLEHASDADEEAFMRGLNELWQRQIVREHAADAYDFSHSKLGEVAYAGLSDTNRQRLHRRVAEALIATHTANLDMAAGEIAAHFEQAGLPDRAIPFYMQAGEAARRMHAHEAATKYYQCALALLPEKDQIGVLLKLGETWDLVGNRTEAAGLYRQALQLAEDFDDPRAQAECRAALGEAPQPDEAEAQAQATS